MVSGYVKFTVVVKFIAVYYLSTTKKHSRFSWAVRRTTHPARARINSTTQLREQAVYDWRRRASVAVMFSAADVDQVDLRHSQAHYRAAQYHHQQQVKSSAGRATAAAAAAAAGGAGSPGKKLIGIRYLFPAFDERTTLLERARVWVARHDHKYFVDWPEAQLQTVDPALRPLAPITRDLYKLHMNRSTPVSCCSLSRRLTRICAAQMAAVTCGAVMG